MSWHSLTKFPPHDSTILPTRSQSLAEAVDVGQALCAIATGSAELIQSVNFFGAIGALERGRQRLRLVGLLGSGFVARQLFPDFFQRARLRRGISRISCGLALPGLRDGSIDVIATDHAPHHRDEKLLEFDKAPSGISGLETALSLSLRLVDEGVLTLAQIVEAMAVKPAAILGIGKGTLRRGADADVVIVDREMRWKVEAEKFASLGKNTPFEGWELKSRPVVTICKGRIHDFGAV